MAGVALVAGLQGDPPPVPGQDFLLLPDPDGGVLNHGGVQNIMEEIRPENQEEKKKLVFKVKKKNYYYLVFFLVHDISSKMVNIYLKIFYLECLEPGRSLYSELSEVPGDRDCHLYFSDPE